ncbi:hypothetical protein LOTGIDRAFT_129702 [Lottia gigantea]|uniref:Protein O-mannosyl-transferase 2 n=1 Tax=Lottia gigantea TaxID=225164 RepID=V3Z5T1_LOTGI|nr:hypothetical protein LOTGIDRAFT_129702 [Lottia gigantea]ESO86133.1 hypothetical protein LOTGIDRAFT_129702 [Lottia gigantea]
MDGKGSVRQRCSKFIGDEKSPEKQISQKLHQDDNGDPKKHVSTLLREKASPPSRSRESVDGKENHDQEVDDIDDNDDSIGRSASYYFCLLVFTSASLASRLYNIENPSHICWDETHFGKMGSWYINRTFFFDVHPPLGKMMIGLAGILTGYDGSFPFSKPGDPYDDTQYVGMRVACALMGAAVVPLSFQIVWLLTHSLVACILASSLILFDTGTLTLSRHILLDPIMLFFIMAATYSMLKFLSFNKKSYTFKWWLWMFITGFFLACSIGVKFVGLFVILLCGISTIIDLWSLFGDLSLTFTDIVKQFIARVIGLILVPAVFYIIFFGIHLKVLNHSGNGDGFFSSAFQAQLIGNKLYNVSMPANIAYGSVLTLKQRRTGGAYLHSHWHLYPDELPPRQQQVTTYSHKDENNYWIIKPADRNVDMNSPPQFVRSGDSIRLEHVVTHRNLHSHREPAPISRRQYQVSGYGQNGTGDANDIWVIEIQGASKGTPVQTVRSKLKIIHLHVRCALHSNDKKLPKWGWEQLEATCHPNIKEPKALWSVEEVKDDRLPNVNFDVYSPSFIDKVIESHAVMTQGNSGLKPKEGEITSRPWQWPINYRGQIFSGKDYRIYLLGNPVIFWLCLVVMVIFLMMFTVYSIRCQRGIKIPKVLKAYHNKMFNACWWLLLGWSLHYLPFWTMTRVLYFHHYFPAFLYSAMLTGIMLDYMIARVCFLLPEKYIAKFYLGSILTVLSSIVYSFYLFHPVTYGMAGPMASDENGMMYGLKWVEAWDI